MDIAPEGIEHAFEKASGFLLQSGSFYQVSGDRAREANVRLMLASVLLDYSTWRRRMIAERASNREQEQTFTDCTRLLDDAAEQCQQVLLGWQDQLEPPAKELKRAPQAPLRDLTAAAELDTMLYVAWLASFGFQCNGQSWLDWREAPSMLPTANERLQPTCANRCSIRLQILHFPGLSSSKR